MTTVFVLSNLGEIPREIMVDIRRQILAGP